MPGKKVSFAPKPYSKRSSRGAPTNKKEGYQLLNLIGTPQHAVEVDDSVYIGENKLLGTYMEPNFKRQPYVPQEHEWTQKLNLFTGRNLKPLLDRPEKKENPPLFKPFKYDYLANRNDVMEQTLAMASRFRDETSTISKNFEKPTPETKVAPGVDIGYNAEPNNRPFHPWYRTPEYNIDELRGEVRPSYSLDRTKIGMKGDKGHLMAKPRNPKRRPESVYGQGNQSRIVPGIGTFSKGANDRLAERIERMVKKPESAEHFGPEYRVHDYTELPEDRKPYVEPVRVRRRPAESVRAGAGYTGRHEDLGYDRTMSIKPKNTKRLSFGHLENDREGNVKPVRYRSLNPNARGTSNRDLYNKDLAIRAVREGAVDLEEDAMPYTNRETLLDKMPQEYDHDRDAAPNNPEQGTRLRNVNGLLVPESNAHTYVEDRRGPGGDNPLRAQKTQDKRSFRFMKEPNKAEWNDRYPKVGGGNATRKHAPNRGAKRGLKDERPQNAYIDQTSGMTGRVGIDHAQGSHKLTKAHAKRTRREETADTERYAGGGRIIGREHRNNRTTRLNSKRPVTVNRQPNGVSGSKWYSDYDNQYMGLTQTNVNRSAATQQPIPYPRTPTMAHYGYNNQIIMGANTRDTRQGNIMSQVDYTPKSLIKPIMQFK